MSVGKRVTAELAKKGIVGSMVAERYVVTGQLGIGGVSTVYKVTHVHLDKVFALKVLHDSSADALQRFQLEGKASTLLEHNNIVRVHDFGIHSEHPYMILDYVEGRSLAQIIEAEGPMEPRRAINIITQVCNALGHAHEQGIVHRDVKPNNIIVNTKNNGQAHVVVLDFGIAKITRGLNALDQKLTRTGDIFGTPLYMSPEQCTGDDVDERADIYSVGCVFYEMLTGRPPFDGINAYHTIQMQLNEAPPPFPQALRSTRLGKQLEVCTLKALAKSPQNRYRFMMELATELKKAELGTGSLLGDVMANIKLASSRMNAVERTRIILHTAMQGLSVLATVAAALLVIAPGQVQQAVQEWQRNDAIIVIVNYVVDQRMNSSDLVAIEDLDLKGQIKLVDHLCKDDKDPEKQLLAQQLIHAAEEARLVSKTVPAVFKQFMEKIFAGGGIESKGMAQEMKHALGRTVQKWAKASQLSSALVSICYNKMDHCAQRIRLWKGLFELAKWGGIIIEISLLTLIIRSVLNARREAAETQTVNFIADAEQKDQ